MSNEHQPGSPGVDLDELDRVMSAYLEALSSAGARHSGPTLLATGAEVIAWFNQHGGEHAAILKISAELRTLRARVGELEKCLNGLHLFAGRGDGHETAGKVTDCIAGVIIQLRADLEKAEARAESAEARIAALEKLFDDAGQGEHNVLALIDHYQSEAMAESEARRAALARVGELECAEADLESQLAEHKSQFANAVEVIRHADRRVVDLESQLAAAREEQGLEAKVREALGPRYQALQLTRLAMSGIWQACWCAPAWSSRNERKAQAPTLPALLRAILEVEAKGG